MPYVTGLMLIDAPASALNNAGPETGARTDNTIAVKKIRAGGYTYPYVSAQAVRFWLRSYLEHQVPGWEAAPVFREAKVAYTDANPLLWWDDDLFGYMRAQSKKAAAKQKREEDQRLAASTPTSTEITRISPLRVGTLVSLGHASVVDDFGTMARHDGDPVPHEHQFYRTTLQGLFSLNLQTAGTFFHGGRVGYRNLDDHRVEEAKARKLEGVSVNGQPAYRLPAAERARRCATLIEAFGELEGGAKQTIHYTDVTPAVLVAAVTRGGNHPFARVFTADRGRPEVHLEALQEVLSVYKDRLLSDVYWGWSRGFLDAERARVEQMSEEARAGARFRWGHPRDIARALAQDLEREDNVAWFE